MAWLPISGTIPQYSTAANALAGDYWLKFYDSGTTTPTNMATDSTGGTTLAKCKLSSDGYPISNELDETTRFIPHIDKDYRIVLYTNETDADNNTTGSAAFNIDGMVLQVVPTGDAANITLRDTTIEAQDDYDRSPLFIDGDGFTAGAGPHVITVPTDWTPTNADMRFYRVDNSGIVTELTPTSTSSTTFTLAETLLSTDVIFIGDDEFRNIFDGDPAANFEAIKQTATTTSTGVIEEATSAELEAATNGKFPDCATVYGYYGQVEAQTLTTTGAGSFTTVNASIARTGNIVTISGDVFHSSATSASSTSTWLPSWAAANETAKAASLSGAQVDNVTVTGRQVTVNHYDWAGAGLSTTSGGITISYTVD